VWDLVFARKPGNLHPANLEIEKENDKDLE
jgi:hypothetical protein